MYCNLASLSAVWKWKWSCSVVSDSLRPHGLQPTRLLRPRAFPGKSTGVGCPFLLQGIFPTQGSNPGLPLYRLSQQRSPGAVCVPAINTSRSCWQCRVWGLAPDLWIRNCVLTREIPACFRQTSKNQKHWLRETDREISDRWSLFGVIRRVVTRHKRDINEVDTRNVWNQLLK